MYDGFALVAVPPLPKAHEYDVMVPSESTEPLEENATGLSSRTVNGLAPATAVGAWFGTATMPVTDAEPVAPSPSVTVNVAV